MACPPVPTLFDVTAQGDPVRISIDETYPVKIRGMLLLYDEKIFHFIILCSSVLD